MATRFRLENEAGNTIDPVVGGSYTHSITTAGPARLTDTALPTALASTAFTPDAADHLVAGDSRHTRFVSSPMTAGVGFVTSDTVKYAVQASEANAGNNLFIQLAVYVVSEDGTTLRATIRSKTTDGTEIATTLTSRTSSHTLDSNYTTVLGDRLLVEISATGTPTASGGTQGHNWTLRLGSNGAGGDLLEDDVQTGTTLNPWIEFSRDISFLIVADEWMGQSCISM